MTITYFNDKKDPKEVSIIFVLNNNTFKWKIDGNFSEPEKFEEIAYRYYFGELNYTFFITPSDDVIKNEGNESYMWQGSIQIPEISKNYQLMLSNETMLNISGNFNRIMNNPIYLGSYFYTAPNETLTIKVQEPIKLNLTEKGISLRTSENLNAYLTELYDRSKKILYFDPYSMQIKYKGEFKRIFGYGSNITLFNGSDS
ncbi:MAG: hypothetical protein BWK75_00380, partial [Candidatus Altiarchaeales archaeon A3]